LWWLDLAWNFNYLCDSILYEIFMICVTRFCIEKLIICMTRLVCNFYDLYDSTCMKFLWFVWLDLHEIFMICMTRLCMKYLIILCLDHAWNIYDLYNSIMHEIFIYFCFDLVWKFYDLYESILHEIFISFLSRSCMK
jgi:hypothetical protein